MNRYVKIVNLLMIILILSFSVNALAEEPFAHDEYPEVIAGPEQFPRTTFHLLIDYERQTNQIDKVDVFTLNPGGSIAILPGTFSISADIWMDIFSGDASGFRFESFGLGCVWAFYNSKPLILSTGIDFILSNQSFEDVAGADVFSTRPFLASGIGIMWFFIGPYIGFPMAFDINNDNDTTPFPKRNANMWDAQTDFGFAIDYGVPISFNLLDSFRLAVEPSGITFIRPEVHTELFITPGFILKFGMFTTRIGVKIRVYPEDSDYERYNLVIRGGLSF